MQRPRRRSTTTAAGLMALVFSAALLLVSTSAAQAAGGTITSPSATPVPTSPSGQPVAFTVSGTGFPAGPVYVEICDGTPQTAPDYNPTLHCDTLTGNAAENSTGPSSTVSFPATDANHAVRPFRGESPSDAFNCLAPEDVRSGAAAKADGSVVPAGATTRNGEMIDLALPSWTDCQVRLASSEQTATADQAGQPYTIANSGGRQSATVTVNAATGVAVARANSPIVATVRGTGPAPTGTVAFNDVVDNQDIAFRECPAVPIGPGGTATCVTDGLQSGGNKVTATYSGDSHYAAATSAEVTYQARLAGSSASGEGSGGSGTKDGSGGTRHGASTNPGSKHESASDAHPASSDGGSGLSTGSVVGIVIAALALGALAVIGAVVIRRRRASTG